MEIDHNEAYCLHFVLYDNHEQPVATCRILPNSDNTVATLQRMAVLKQHRKKQFGHKLLQAVIEFCKEKNLKQ